MPVGNPSTFIAAMLPLFQLPRIIRVEILSIFEFPAPLLLMNERVEWLTLDRFRIDVFADAGKTLPSFPKLKRIDFHDVAPVFGKKFPLLHAPNLRQISIGGYALNVQHTIESGKDTIEDVVLYNYTADPRVYSFLSNFFIL